MPYIEEAKRFKSTKSYLAVQTLELEAKLSIRRGEWVFSGSSMVVQVSGKRGLA